MSPQEISRNNDAVYVTVHKVLASASSLPVGEDDADLKFVGVTPAAPVMSTAGALREQLRLMVRIGFRA